LIGLGMLPGFDRHVVPERVRAAFHFRHNSNTYRSEHAVWKLQRDNHYRYGNLGTALARYAKPGESFVTGVIGNVGYYSDLYIYDQYGLVDRNVARRPLKQSKLHSPGHDKLVPASFFLKRRPTYWTVTLLPRRGARRAALEWAKKHEAFGHKHRYVPDFAVIDGEAFHDQRPRVLVVLKAGEEGPIEEQWREFRRRAGRRL
jgi:hypothetical protein